MIVNYKIICWRVKLCRFGRKSDCRDIGIKSDGRYIFSNFDSLIDCRDIFSVIYCTLDWTLNQQGLD